MAIPVVASDIPGPQELVVNGVTGLLVPPGDVEALANAIVAVLSDEAKAKAMGEAGYRQAQLRFDARTNAEATFEVYERVLRGEEADSQAKPQTSSKGTRVHPLWGAAFLIWTASLVGMYVWKMLHVGNRWDRVQDIVGRFFG